MGAGARRLDLERWIAALLVLLLVAGLSLGGATGRWDSILYDTAIRGAARAADDRIVIIAIDDLSLQEIGPWPWPREVHAALVERIASARPRAVAYDILFIDPSPRPEADAALAAAFTRLDVGVLPLHLSAPGPEGAAFLLQPPIPPLARAAAGFGHVNLQFDPDGVVRRASLLDRTDALDIVHLVEAAQRIAQGERMAAPESRAIRTLLRSAPVLIPYRGPPGHFATYSAGQVLRGEALPETLAGRYVLVGATAGGLRDRYATPTSGPTQLMPGVEIQAHLLAARLDEALIRPLGLAGGLIYNLAPVLLLGMALRRLAPHWIMILGLGLAGALLGLSAALLAFANLWAAPVAGLIGLTVLPPLWSWRRLAATDRYVRAELARFAAAPGLIPPAPGVHGDPLSGQIAALESAIAHAEDLRRFATETLQASPDPAYVLDVEDRVIFANRAGQALAPAAQGRPFAEIVKAWRAEAAAAPAGQPISASLELRAPDGRVFQLDRRRLALPQDEAVSLVRLADITALRAAALQRERMMQFLSHDMRSPLASILALLATSPQAKWPETARRIDAYARRTLALADGFLHLARAESSDLDLELLDLGDLLVEAADELWPQAQARGVRIYVEAEAPLPLMGDRMLLSRALQNLLQNALKHSPSPGEVEVHAYREGDHLVCTINDRGPGLPPDALARIFQPFRRGGSGGQDGAGLGLAIVAEVARRHGGEAHAAPRPGGGASFSLTLPTLDVPPPDP